MYKPWICYRVRSYFIFSLFLIFEILQKSELLPWFELKRGVGRARAGLAGMLVCTSQSLFYV